jgi:hypothetical protein
VELLEREQEREREREQEQEREFGGWRLEFRIYPCLNDVDRFIRT